MRFIQKKNKKAIIKKSNGIKSKYYANKQHYCLGVVTLFLLIFA